MSRVKREMRRQIIGGHAVNIDGKNLNIHFARVVYKCAECFSDLEIKDFGLKCKTNHEHRRFVHRDEVAKLQKQRSKYIDDLKEVYKIVDGKVVIK